MYDIESKIGKVILYVLGTVFFLSPLAHAAELPPDPNNAALLYYQAFLLRPELDADTEELIRNSAENIANFLRGAEPEPELPFEQKPYRMLYDKERKILIKVPNKKEIETEPEKPEKQPKSGESSKKIRKYIKSCQGTIEIAQAASQIRQCDWGLLYSKGFSMPMPQLTKSRELMFVLNADALILADSGDYRAAFERCLMMRRFARHVGDDTVLMFCVSHAVDGIAQGCMRYLLGSLPAEKEMLTWLKDQLNEVPGLPQSFDKALWLDFKIALQSIQKEVSNFIDKQVTEANDVDLSGFTDEVFVMRGRELYSDFLSSSLEIIKSDSLYSEKYAKIERLMERLKEIRGLDPVALGLEITCADQVLNLYRLQVMSEASFNSLMAAIDIYLIKARTGQLPQALPEGLFKDPYGGNDFEYEITEDGFILRCRVKPVDGREFRQYEFKVKK